MCVIASYHTLRFYPLCYLYLFNTQHCPPCGCYTPAIQVYYTVYTMSGSTQFSASKYLDDIEESGIGTDNLFCEDNLKEVRNSSGMLFSDMCRVFGVEGAKNLSPSTLNKHSVSKAQMAEFLFTAVYLLDHCCLPLMSSATSQLETLQSEKISDQKTIIELQQDLISKKNEELGEVSKSVEAGLKTYSSALQQSCTKALSPSNIVAAVKTVTQEEDRSKELVLFGVTEEAGERVTTQVTKVLEQIDEKPQVKQCRRIGQPNAGAARPIIFSVRSPDIVYQILKKAKQLRDIEGYKTIYISPNRTREERIARQKLVSELKEKRRGDQNSRYFIRKGEIVQVALEESFHSTD